MPFKAQRHHREGRSIYVHREKALPDRISALYHKEAEVLSPEARPHLGCDVLHSHDEATACLEKIANELDAEMRIEFRGRYARAAHDFMGPLDDNKIYAWVAGLVSMR